MKKLMLSALLAATIAAPASAAVVTLESLVPAGSNFTWTYQGSLSPDEGVVAGSKLIVFDFAGYVPGSIFSPSADLATSIELFSATPFILPPYTDDPTIPNLVFTWVGAPMRNTGGPLPSFDFDGLGAVSIYGNKVFDAFTTWTVKNNPPADAGKLIIELGALEVPNAVPEPAAWAMLFGGFAILGGAMRRRRGSSTVIA